MAPSGPIQPHSPLAVLSLLYAATFWGLVWYPLRWLEDGGMSGAWQALASYGAALLLLLPLLRPGDPWRARSGDLLALALAAGWCNLAFILAMLDGQVARVLLLFYLSPLWAFFFGRLLLGERIAPQSLVWVATGVAGSVIMLWRPGTEQLLPGDAADWLALSAGMAFALTNVMIRRLHGFSQIGKAVTTWTGVIAVSAVALLVTGAAWPQSAPGVWGGAVLLGVAGFFFATFAVQYGVTHMPVQRSSVILLFELVVGTASAAVLAAERLGWHEWLGGLLILVAGTAAIRREVRE